jgi:hypothetical protein
MEPLYDWDRIKQLVEIVDMLRGHPSLKAIADAAMAELELIANPPEDEAEAEDEKEPEDE